jgi:hypothetical protein
MKPLDGHSRLAVRRPAGGRLWLLDALAKFRCGLAGKGRRVVGRQGAGAVGGSSVDGGGSASIARGSWPVSDRAVIAAVCECPSLTYELLVATRDGSAVEQVELDATSRPAASLVRDEDGA